MWSNEYTWTTSVYKHESHLAVNKVAP